MPHPGSAIAITGEQFTLASSNIEDGARLDISANGFWGGRCEKTYIDVKVFNPHAPSNRTTSASAIYRKHDYCVRSVLTKLAYVKLNRVPLLL